jgi:hypothetical protein
MTYGDTVTEVTGYPGVSVVVLGYCRRKLGYVRRLVVHVNTYVPTETVAKTENIGVDVELPTLGCEGTDVHVIEYETGSVAKTESGDVLVLTLGPEVSEVGVNAVIQETTLETDFLRGGHLRLKSGVRAVVTIAETATPVLGSLECRIYRQRICILTYLCNSTSYFKVRNNLVVLQERKLSCNE